MPEILIDNIILADNVKVCKDIFSRSKGLRFSKRLKKGQAILLIATEESIFETIIDMFFVFFSIDIIWLDKNKRVVDIRRNVKPFSPLIMPLKPAKYVIELPKNASKHVKINDVIKFNLEQV